MDSMNVDNAIKLLKTQKIKYWRLLDAKNNCITQWQDEDAEEGYNYLRETVEDSGYKYLYLGGYIKPVKNEDVTRWGNPSFKVTIKNNSVAEETPSKTSISSGASSTAMFSMLIAQMEKNNTIQLETMHQSFEHRMKIFELENKLSSKSKKDEPSALETMVLNIISNYMTPKEVTPIQDKPSSEGNANNDLYKVKLALSVFNESGFSPDDLV